MKPFIPEDFMQWLLLYNYFNAIGSIRYHSAYEGGLFDHSLTVTEALVTFTKKFDLHWQLERSPYIIGIFHDLCKIDMFIRNDSGVIIENPNQQIIGHGDKSVILLQDHVNLTEEERLCIRYHMNSYDTPEIKGESGIYYHQNPNAFFTHMADAYAAVVLQI